MNSSQELQNRIQAIVADSIQVPLDMVTADLAFGDIPQWDSLGHMEIILHLEEAYDLSIDTELIARLVSIPEICKYIEENNHVAP